MSDMQDLTDLSLCEAGHLLDDGAVSSMALTQACLKRIEATEPKIHAFALLLREQALEAAEQADRAIAVGKRRSPLHGVPIAVKDNFYTRGIPTEAGSQVLRGFVPDYDATAVRMLKGAGAILLGKTVCHEFGVGVNEPPTRTPWAMTSYPGGSSAGSAVAVAARAAYGAIGSDTGGSIRIPASINNIVGLKPTYGRVSGYGVIPLAWSLDHVGPLTRTVRDCALLLQAIAGPDPKDPSSAVVDVPDYLATLDQSVQKMRIGIERSYFFYDGMVADVRRLVDDVIQAYARMGVEIIEVSLPELNFTQDALFTIMMAEAATYHEVMLREHSNEYSPATRANLQLGALIPATHYLTAQRARAIFRSAMADMFKAHALDALLAPTMPLPTVPLTALFVPRKDIRENASETPMGAYVHHTFAANLTGQPAISIPCGLTPDGLPVGFQLTGRPFAEAEILRLGHAFEFAQPWHVARRPPLAMN
jgi:aspartyl-tRNA(Asn)/glutamyl-tRNA(Gln) amidotransferase subunit A